MRPLTPDLKMYPHLIMFDDGLHFNMSNAPVYAIDGESALELAAIEKWRGKPVWIIKRTPEQLAELPKLDPQLADPQSLRNPAEFTPEYARRMGR